MIKIISSDQILLTAFDISEFTEKGELKKITKEIFKKEK